MSTENSHGPGPQRRAAAKGRRPVPGMTFPLPDLLGSAEREANHQIAERGHRPAVPPGRAEPPLRLHDPNGFRIQSGDGAENPQDIDRSALRDQGSQDNAPADAVPERLLGEAGTRHGKRRGGFVRWREHGIGRCPEAADLPALNPTGNPTDHAGRFPEFQPLPESVGNAVFGPERRWDLHRFEHFHEIGAREEGSEPRGRIADRRSGMLGFGFRRGIPQAERRRGGREEVDPVRFEGGELVAPPSNEG